MIEPTYHTDKSTLRSVFLDKRKTLTISEYQKKNAQLLYHIIRALSDLNVKTVHSFLPIRKQKEVNTWPIIELLQSHDKQVIISRSEIQSNKLTHFVFESTDQLVINKWGIPEPTDGKQINANEIDLVFVPLIVFDKKGHRIGYGKGYYDRFLSECRDDCIKIGLSLSPALDKIEFAESHDFALDYCISPLKLYHFNK